MRRPGVILALGALLGMLGNGGGSPAHARGPRWQFMPVEPFTLPSLFCGFEGKVTPIVDKEVSVA